MYTKNRVTNPQNNIFNFGCAKIEKPGESDDVTSADQFVALLEMNMFLSTVFNREI